MQTLYIENYKTLSKDIKEDLKKWSDIPYSLIKDLTLLRWQYSPNFSTDLLQSQ